MKFDSSLALLGLKLYDKTHRMKILDLILLQKNLWKCGKYLESASFNTKNNELTSCALNKIALYCPNIKEISVLNSNLESLTNLGRNCTTLIKLSLLKPIYDDNNIKNQEYDKALSVLFSNNNKLENIFFNLNTPI